MAVITISVDGIDKTNEIVIADARFDSQVNGQPGTGSFRIRDDAGNYSVSQGAEVLLEIDGAAVWRGFVTQVKRVYIAPALNVAESGLTRFIAIEATDLNILFQRRIVFNQTTPEDTYGTLFPPDTHDDVAIADLIANFLDLSGDGLDTTTLVDHVGSLDPEQDTRAWSGGDTWAQAMASISAIPAAIWYIDPDRDLVYCDADTPDGPFGLSDRPDYDTTFGYREMEILTDGSQMVNDMLAWGVGYGSADPVFSRVSDTDSSDAHGVWQGGKLVSGVYKQGTIDRIAESVVFGSPQSLRGATDDRLAIMCVTYKAGLRPAHKINFTSDVFNFSQTLPIRKMEVTFPAADTPRYALTLSFEIDMPWSFIDPFILKLPKIVGPPPPPPPPPPPVACGITDTFTRLIPEFAGWDWGTCDAGILWSTAGSSSSNMWVDGSKGIIDVSQSDGSNGTGTLIFSERLFLGAEIISQAAFRGFDGIDANEIMVFQFTDGTADQALYKFQEIDGVSITATLDINGTEVDSASFLTYTPRVLHQTKFIIEAGNFNVYSWELPGTQPILPILSWPIDSTLFDMFRISATGAGSGAHLEVDQIDIVGVNYCTETGIPFNTGFPGGMFGFGCETAIRSTVSPNIVLTSSRYTPNTTQVFVNFLLQRPVIDYVENSDQRSITLLVAPLSSDVVQVCYIAMGVVTGIPGGGTGGPPGPPPPPPQPGGGGAATPCGTATTSFPAGTYTSLPSISSGDIWEFDDDAIVECLFVINNTPNVCIIGGQWNRPVETVQGFGGTIEVHNSNNVTFRDMIMRGGDIHISVTGSNNTQILNTTHIDRSNAALYFWDRCENFLVEGMDIQPAAVAYASVIGSQGPLGADYTSGIIRNGTFDQGTDGHFGIEMIQTPRLLVHNISGKLGECLMSFPRSNYVTVQYSDFDLRGMNSAFPANPGWGIEFAGSTGGLATHNTVLGDGQTDNQHFVACDFSGDYVTVTYNEVTSVQAMVDGGGIGLVVTDNCYTDVCDIIAFAGSAPGFVEARNVPC